MFTSVQVAVDLSEPKKTGRAAYGPIEMGKTAGVASAWP